MKLIKKVVLLWALLFAAPAIAAPSNFLVSTDWLEKNLKNPILKFEYITFYFLIFQKFSRNF